MWIIVSALILTIFVELPFGNIKKLVFNNKKAPLPASKPSLDMNMNDVVQETKELNGLANGNGVHKNGSAKKVD